MKKLFSLLTIFLFAIIGIATVSAGTIPVDLTKLEIDDIDVDVNDPVVRLSLERGDEFEIRLTLEAINDTKDVEITAFITGYEYNDKERISDSTHVFDVEAGVKYIKKLDLKLPVKADEDDYKLRVIISDRYNEEIIKNYNLKIDVPRHSLSIRDVIFIPGKVVKAGRALLSTVRVENQGEKDEDSIKVKVAIPSLGLSASDYIDEIENDETESSEELYLRIPACAEGGDYKVTVTVEYDDSYEEITKDYLITVIPEESCEVPGPVEGKTIISVGPEVQNVKAGSKAVFPITLSNAGASAKTYTINVKGAEFADVEVSPSNIIVLNGGEAKAVYVYVTPSADAEGQNLFSVSVVSDGKTLKELPMKVDVTGAKKSTSSLRRGLEIALVVLVVLLVIIGLIIGFSKLRGEEEPEEDEKTYY